MSSNSLFLFLVGVELLALLEEFLLVERDRLAVLLLFVALDLPIRLGEVFGLARYAAASVAAGRRSCSASTMW